MLYLSMQEIVEKLASIELRIKELADRYSLLKEENSKLQEENRVLINDLEQLRNDNKRLESQLTESLAAVKAGKRESEERSKLKKELGQYIKEIDKCILMMGDI